MAPRKSMTSVSGNSGEPNGGVISLTIEFAKTTIISLPSHQKYFNTPLIRVIILFFLICKTHLKKNGISYYL